MAVPSRASRSITSTSPGIASNYPISTRAAGRLPPPEPKATRASRMSIRPIAGAPLPGPRQGGEAALLLAEVQQRAERVGQGVEKGDPERGRARSKLCTATYCGRPPRSARPCSRCRSALRGSIFSPAW